MPAKDSAANSKPAPTSSKAAPAPRKTATATQVTATVDTVKIRKSSSKNQAVVTRKAPRSTATLPVMPVSERARLVAEAAYFLAEKRQFDPLGAESDWFEAEAQVDGAYRFT